MKFIFLRLNFIVVVAFMFTPAQMFATDLCERLNGIVSLHERLTNETKLDRAIEDSALLTHLMLREIISSTEKIDNETELEMRYYDRFGIEIGKIGRTLHTHYELPLDQLGFVNDTIMILELPKDYSAAPWTRLNGKQRLTFAKEVTNFFAKGIYDRSLETDLLRASLSSANHALSPRLLLKAAYRRELAGVCRHANCALAGILGEVGIEPKNLRLVEGGKENTIFRHIWVEIRIDDSGDWLQLDGTGANEDKPVGNPYENLLQILNLTIGTATQKITKIKNLREIYPLSIKEFNDFLTPRLASELGLTENDISDLVMTREQMKKLNEETLKKIFGDH